MMVKTASICVAVKPASLNERDNASTSRVCASPVAAGVVLVAGDEAVAVCAA